MKNLGKIQAKQILLANEKIRYPAVAPRDVVALVIAFPLHPAGSRAAETATVFLPLSSVEIAQIILLLEMHTCILANHSASRKQE